MTPPATSPTISEYRQSTHGLNSFSSHLATFFSDGQMSYHPLWSAKLVSQERQGEELGVIHMAPNLIGVPLSSLRDILIVCHPPTPHFQAFRAQTITASVAYLGDAFEQFHRRHSHIRSFHPATDFRIVQQSCLPLTISLTIYSYTLKP